MLVDAGRPRHRAGAGVPPRRPRRRADGRGTSRRPHHLRHPADVSRHRLRLHPPRRRGRPAARASASTACSGFRRSRNADAGRAVRRLRRILLEQRHLRLEGRDDPGRTARAAAGPARRRAAHRRRLGDAATASEVLRARVRGAGEDQHRLRRDGARPRRCWWCRRRTAGTTSAAGWPWSACTRRTPTATRCWRRTAASTRKDCVIVGDAGRLIATIGVENLLIIQDGDATLVADRREEGTVKQLVELLKKKGLEKYL